MAGTPKILDWIGLSKYTDLLKNKLNSLTTSISNVSSKADKATNAASIAQSTADTAYSTANSANQKANEIQSQVTNLQDDLNDLENLAKQLSAAMDGIFVYEIGSFKTSSTATSQKTIYFSTVKPVLCLWFGVDYTLGFGYKEWSKCIFIYKNSSFSSISSASIGFGDTYVQLYGSNYVIGTNTEYYYIGFGTKN